MRWRERAWQERAGDVCVRRAGGEGADDGGVDRARRDARLRRRGARGGRGATAAARRGARRATPRGEHHGAHAAPPAAAQKAHPTPSRGSVRTASRARCSAAVRSLPSHRARLCAGRQAAAALCCTKRHPACRPWTPSRFTSLARGPLDGARCAAARRDRVQKDASARRRRGGDPSNGAGSSSERRFRRRACGGSGVV
jgi:hypothetical protein